MVSIIRNLANSPFSISFSANIKEIEDSLRHTERWVIPYVTSSALSATAWDAVQAEKAKIRGVFDRPTTFTVNSVLYRIATADNLTYWVFIRDEAARGTAPATYLLAQVLGGARKPKPFEVRLRASGVMMPNEFAIPAIGMRRDRFGNLPASIVSKFLSQLGARLDKYQNSTARSMKRNAAKGGAVYFVPGPNSGLPRGIYERLSNRKVRAVVVFVSAQHSYRKRYDFGQAASAKAVRVFGMHWVRAFDRQMAKIR